MLTFALYREGGSTRQAQRDARSSSEPGAGHGYIYIGKGDLDW
jgi:hypothetical protein